MTLHFKIKNSMCEKDEWLLLCPKLDECPRKDKGYFDRTGPFSAAERVLVLSHTDLTMPSSSRISENLKSWNMSRSSFPKLSSISKPYNTYILRTTMPWWHCITRCHWNTKSAKTRAFSSAGSNSDYTWHFHLHVSTVSIELTAERYIFNCTRNKQELYNLTYCTCSCSPDMSDIANRPSLLNNTAHSTVPTSFNGAVSFSRCPRIKSQQNDLLFRTQELRRLSKESLKFCWR